MEGIQKSISSSKNKNSKPHQQLNMRFSTNCAAGKKAEEKMAAERSRAWEASEWKTPEI